MNIAADYLSEMEFPLMVALLVPILIAECGENPSVLLLVAVQAVNGLRSTTNQRILNRKMAVIFSRSFFYLGLNIMHQIWNIAFSILSSKRMTKYTEAANNEQQERT